MELSQWEELIKDIPGSSFTCISPRSYHFTLAINGYDLTIAFFLPLKYPMIPPIYEICQTNLPPQPLKQIETRLFDCCFSGRPPFSVDLLVREISTLFKRSHLSTQAFDALDSTEACRLHNETSLNLPIRREWIQDRFSQAQRELPNEHENLRTVFLIYCLFRSLKGAYSFSECLSYLSNDLQVIHPPFPSIETIPRLIGKLLDESRDPSFICFILDRLLSLFFRTFQLFPYIILVRFVLETTLTANFTRSKSLLNRISPTQMN